MVHFCLVDAVLFAFFPVDVVFSLVDVPFDLVDVVLDDTVPKIVSTLVVYLLDEIALGFPVVLPVVTKFSLSDLLRSIS